MGLCRPDNTAKRIEEQQAAGGARPWDAAFPGCASEGPSESDVVTSGARAAELGGERAVLDECAEGWWAETGFLCYAMVTMKTQRLNEFDLHVRAFLELPITQNMIDDNFSEGASHVVLAESEGNVHSYEGIEKALLNENIDIRIFGKLTSRKYRRMAVVLSPSLDEAKEAAKKIKVIIK